MHEETQRSFQKSCRRSRRFFLHNGDVSRFDTKLSTQFATGKAGLLSQLRHGLPKIEELSRNRVMRIRRHVFVVEVLKVVFHK